jgi:hypothetical protein
MYFDKITQCREIFMETAYLTGQLQNSTVWNNQRNVINAGLFLTCLISFLMAWTFSRLATAPFFSVSSASLSGDVKGEETGTMVDIPYIEIPILHENANKGHVIMIYEAKQQAR